MPLPKIYFENPPTATGTTRKPPLTTFLYLATTRFAADLRTSEEGNLQVHGI